MFQTFPDDFVSGHSSCSHRSQPAKWSNLPGSALASFNGGTSAASWYQLAKATIASIRSMIWPRSQSSANCASADFRCRRSAESSASCNANSAGGWWKLLRAASEYHLLTDGRHIFLEDSARGVVDLLKNARQPMLTVCLSDTVERIQSRVNGTKKRSASVRHHKQQRRRAS